MSERPTGGEVQMPISRRMLLVYALPAMPLAALGLPLYSLVPTYYTEILGLPIAAVGWALLLVRMFDAVSDPLVGYAADRIRPDFGRRRLLFLISLPVAAVSAFMLYWPPADVGIGWLTFWGMLVSLGFTLAIVPYSAWGAELVADYHGRTRLTATREGLTLVGTLIAIVLPFAIGFEQKGFSGLAVLGLVCSPVAGLRISHCLARAGTRRCHPNATVIGGGAVPTRPQSAFPSLDRCVLPERPCKRHTGHAVSLFRLGTAATARHARPLDVPLFLERHCRRTAGGSCGKTARQTPRLGHRHACCLRDLCRCAASVGRSAHSIRPDLCCNGPLARFRPRHPALDSSRCH